MNKRKLLTLALTLCMAAILAIGGTMAYFTDTDSAKNVFTVGNAEIEQTEWQRDGKDSFEAFDDNKLLMPGVYFAANENHALDANWKVFYNDADTTIGETQLNIDDAWNGFWGAEEDGYDWNPQYSNTSRDTYNAMDKIVVVKNTGEYPVYYRTLIAVEQTETTLASNGAYKKKVLLNTNGNSRFDWDNEICVIKIDGVSYMVYEAVYNEVLEADEVSRPSMLQVMLSYDLTNEEVEEFNGKLDVLVLSQAVQVKGFETYGAAAALNEAFGETTEANATVWFEDIAK